MLTRDPVVGGVVAVDVALPSPGTQRSSRDVGLAEQTLAVGRRAVVRTLRQRALLRPRTDALRRAGAARHRQITQRMLRIPNN